jgi:diguanylate cyclase (GGDEF)-like protein
MEVFSVQHGFIMLNDKESPGYLKVVAAASNDPQPSLPSGRVRIGEGIAGWVAQTGQPYLHNPGEEAWKGEEGGAIRRRLWQAAETSVGRAFPETARREPPPSNLLCVPILHGPRPIGVITLEERRTGPFVPREAEFLSLIGRELSGAIDKARLQDEIQELSITDELTGLPNRRYFNRRFHEELARARRSQFPVTVTMLDIDHFKQVNDTYGHPFGDEVLRALARALQSVVREADILARYGGEEFVVVSPECTTHLARRLVQRIQNAVANVVVVFAETQEVIGITVSLGLASFPDDAEEGVAVIECADLALYHAKRSGRDRACVYDEIKDIQLPPEGPDH